jgi:hypothetical protein
VLRRPSPSPQVWSVGGKFGRSAAVGAVQPPSAQHIEKQGWTYVSKPSQVARKAHEPQTEITGLSFTQVRGRGCGGWEGLAWGCLLGHKAACLRTQRRPLPQRAWRRETHQLHAPLFLVTPPTLTSAHSTFLPSPATPPTHPTHPANRTTSRSRRAAPTARCGCGTSGSSPPP